MADSTRLELEPQQRPRRSHAERRAETRAKIIDAVVESIADVGFQGTTSSEITRRAGVTWGAVQHHFGGKDGMLMAVLEDSFNRFAERIEQIPVDATSIDERAALFVERAWAHFSSRYYRATFEILLCYVRLEHSGPDGPGSTHDDSASWQSRMTQAWDEVWSRLFADARVSRKRSLILQRYTVSVLSGLGSTTVLAGDDAADVRQELTLLTETIRRELSGDAG